MATVLAAGDIAFVSFQSDNSGGGYNGDGFQFVLLKSVDAGTTIYFTDNGYRTDTGTYTTTEEVLRWVAQSNLSAGTILTFVAPGGSPVANTAEWTGIVSTTGATAANASLNLTVSGDNITALQSPSFGGANALNGTALAALHFGAADFATTYIGGNTSQTALPPGLVDGVSAIALGPTRNGRYDESTSGSRESGSPLVVGTSINTDTHWVTANTPLAQHLTSATFVLPTPGNDTITGDSAADLIDMLAGNDVYDGAVGNDTITGGLGNDTLTGGSGADTFNRDVYDATAAQSDTVTDFAVAEDKIDLQTSGPASYEVLVNHLLRSNASAHAELRGAWNSNLQLTTLTGVAVASLSASNFVFDTSGTARSGNGTAGNDQLFGGLGNDTYDGGDGADFLAGDAGSDSLSGGNGNDRFDGGAGADTFSGGAGLDRVDYNVATTLLLNASGIAQADSSSEALGDTFVGIEHIRGSALDDNINASTAVAILSGFDGNDTLTGGSGTNEINGGSGNDEIHGGGASGAPMVGDHGGTRTSEVLYGGDGNDTINVETLAGQTAYAWGDAGNDTIHGGAGSDILNGGDDNDTIFGNDGDDVIDGGAGADVIGSGAGNDTMIDNDGMSGDTYLGGAGADGVTYATGNSFNFSAAGADVIDAAVEYVTFKNASTVIGSSGVDRFNGSGNNADNFSGVAGNDWLVGWGGNDQLDGGADNDRLDGGLGADTIRGGAGSDVLTGGNPNTTSGDGAADVFFYVAADIDAADAITDFVVGTDQIGLDAASFGLAAGALESNRFMTLSAYQAGGANGISGDVFAYNASNGYLYWDADGATAGGLKLMAILQNKAAIGASDFVVI